MPSTSPLSCLAVAAVLGLAMAPVRAETYRLDPVHTRVVFVVDHAGLSRAIGSFSGVQGRLDFDPEAWADASVAVTVPLATLHLGDDGWRDAVLDGTFLDAGDFPDAHFVSTAVRPAGDGRLHVDGMLTLRGVARPVRLDARLNAVKRHPITRRRSAGFSATATLRRSDFGIGAWPNVVGDDIELLIEAEAVVDAKAAAPVAPPQRAVGPTDVDDTSDPPGPSDTDDTSDPPGPADASDP